MFEKGKAIREAQKARMEKRARERGRREGEERERERIKEVLEASGVELPPAVYEMVVGKRREDNSESS